MPSFTILGTDRARGAIGLVEPFRFHVIAEDAEEARGRAYRLRCAERQDVHIECAFETIGEADVRTFMAEAKPPADGAYAVSTARDALEFLRQFSDQLNAIDTRRCNEPCGPEVDVEERRLELRARTLAAEYGLTLIRQSDARGCALAIATPKSGRFNSVGGAEAGWYI